MAIQIASRVGKLPENWTKSNYTKEEMDNAFLDGMLHQEKSAEKKIKAVLDKNIDLATSLSEKLFHLGLEQLQVKMKKAYLKIDDINSFSTLFVVSKKDYFSDNFKKIYQESFRLKNENKSDSFYISFKFMADGKNLNTDCIRSDGYVFEYGA